MDIIENPDGRKSIEFKDVNTNRCVLENFTAYPFGPHILFSVKEAKIKKVNEQAAVEDFAIPPNCVLLTHMVLDRDVVKKLLPYLENFVKEGSIFSKEENNEMPDVR